MWLYYSAMIFFFGAEVTWVYSQKYGSRYQGQRGPTASRSHQSFHRTRIPDTPAAPADGAAPISQEKHL